MVTERDLLPDCSDIFEEDGIGQNPDLRTVRIRELILRDKYDAFQGTRCEHHKPQCRGGFNFGMTIRTVWKSTNGDMIAVTSVADTLDAIADWAAAGSIAWELRRFIRRAAPDQTIEFSQLLLEVARGDDGRLKNGPSFIDMDDVFWSGSQACQGEIEMFKRAYFKRKTLSVASLLPPR